MTDTELNRLQAALDTAEKENERLLDEAVQRIQDAPDGETIARAVAEYGSAEAAVQEVENTKLIFERARAEAAERALADAQAMADKYKADTIELNATVTELQAAKAQAEEDAHYANGVTDLALQRRDTAEAQAAVLRDTAETVCSTYYATSGRCPGRPELAYDPLMALNNALASLPDSAAKLRAVGDAAEKLRKTKLALLDSPVDDGALKQTYDAERELFDAVAAYKASGTEPSK